jgi:hypothetical protein
MLLCAAPHAELPKGPPASEMAKLYFLAGDLRKAIETARAGTKSPDAARCKALYPMLVEYEFALSRAESLTPAEAKAFLDWDRKISPGTPGKLTAAVVRRYVDAPLQLARTAEQGGELAKARRLVVGVLQVDATNTDALALRDALDPPDAGSKTK